MRYPLLPFELAKFWYIDAPLGLLAYFSSLNTAYFRVFSVGLLFKTLFQPIKNEYRQGLVGFSIGMGIVVKTTIIFVSLLFFILMLAAEFLFITLFILLPILSIVLFFLAI